MKAGESPLDKAAAGSTVPKPKIAAMERCEAGVPGMARDAARRRLIGCASWRSIPSGLPRGNGMKAPPRLANNRGGAALAKSLHRLFEN